ncbi:hypothetical protein [Aliikangiella coralliicola]|uniref:Uncharacterized protein n=1 Tax=Aliikangiella coralliicola TaxID=2592383 RepID=A0A545UHR2_9GAMM|nr:hypothetical protein [Aliikangiella coralliicola]TQV89006.1 hypothetical protein FLL46_05610 [Aliikangiella coralliicola]
MPKTSSLSQTIPAVVTQGYMIASGKNKQSPYPMGSIQMQIPHFNQRGLNLERYYPATLNLLISPKTFKILKADYLFQNVNWAQGFPAEDFSFITCEIEFQKRWFNSFIYYPHPETKIDHFQNESTLEVITDYLSGIEYGDMVNLKVSSEKLVLK